MPVTVCSYIRTAGQGGKFIVLQEQADPDSGILVFSDFTRDFQHYDILMRWQQGRGATAPAAGLRVAGGGWWKMEGDMLVVYGQSAAYGRFDPDWVRERLQPGMLLTEARIDVR